MSIKVMTSVWANCPYGGSKLLMMLALADFANDDGESIFPKVETLAKKIRLDERMAQRILRFLEKNGDITVEKRGHVWRKGGQRTNEITINLAKLAQCGDTGDTTKVSVEKNVVTPETPQVVTPETPQSPNVVTPEPPNPSLSEPSIESSNIPDAPEQITLPFAESDSEEKPTVRAAAGIMEKGKKAKETPKPRERDLLFDAVAEVTLSNVTLQGSRIGKVTADLRKINATPEQVHQVATWFAENDWRAKAGGKLTFAILMEVWECGVKNVKMEVKKNGKMTLRAQVPEATDQERDIAREKAAARIAERRANGHVPLHERISVTGMEVGK